MELDTDDVDMLKRMVRWMKNCQVQGGQYENTPEGGFVIRIPPPPPRPYVPKFKLLYGTVQNQYAGAASQPWNPGTNYCTLTPCTDDSGSTPTGGPNVNVYVMHPLGRPASFFGALANDVLAYIAQPMVGSTDSMSGSPALPLAGVLLQPPIPPTGQQFASALENQSGTPAHPNYQATWVKVHA